MQPSDLNEAPLTGELQVQVFRDGRASDSVGHVGADQELVAQVQQLDVQRHGLLPLWREERVAVSGREGGVHVQQVTESHQFVVQVNSTDFKVKHEEFCHTSGGETIHIVSHG